MQQWNCAARCVKLFRELSSFEERAYEILYGNRGNEREREQYLRLPVITGYYWYNIMVLVLEFNFHCSRSPLGKHWYIGVVMTHMVCTTQIERSLRLSYYSALGENLMPYIAHQSKSIIHFQ